MTLINNQENRLDLKKMLTEELAKIGKETPTLAELNDNRTLRNKTLIDLEERKKSYSKQINEIREQLKTSKEEGDENHNLHVTSLVAQSTMQYLESTMEQISSVGSASRNTIDFRRGL